MPWNFLYLVIAYTFECSLWTTIKPPGLIVVTVCHRKLCVCHRKLCVSHRTLCVWHSRLGRGLSSNQTLISIEANRQHTREKVLEKKI